MTRGRKPIPAELHVLQGTFRPARHAGSTPHPTAGIPPCPKHLDAVARKEYRRVGKLLAETKTLTLVDMVGLACYAQAWSRLIEGETKLRETGLVIKSPAGFPCISPFLSVVRQATEELRKWSVELGMTPAGRAKIKAPPAGPNLSAAALLQQARKA